MTRTHRGLAAALVTLIAIGASVASSAPARSPAGRVVVVTANLQEAYTSEDLRDLREMRVFVDRLLTKVPFRPDVLLLQEVRRRSAARVAALLSDRTGDNYVMAVAPPRRPVRRITTRKYRHTETGIVINTATIRRLSRGRFQSLPYTWDDRAAGESSITIMRSAFVLLQERGTGVKMPFTSVHYLPKAHLRSGKREYYYNKWARMLAANVARRWPSHRTKSSIGGDFNHQRCRYEVRADCSPAAPFYKTLTETYRYKDAYRLAYNVRLGFGVDFIFTRPAVIDADRDMDYDPGGDPSKFYSDHQFRWALIEV